ncbi:MAG TPA: hypothetical protein VN753_07025 [Terracidiphilus sp.]|jgi:hypothetical protein|nr:hypothetical protein [Terracidiphilus sp.]
MRRIFAVAVALFLSIPLSAQNAAHQDSSVKPKVRAITAFVRLDRATWEKQIAEALVVLRRTQKEFESWIPGREYPNNDAAGGRIDCRALGG